MTTDSQPLEIQHDCTYLVHMHSKPYPYGDPAFATTMKYTVPTCIDGYCSCASQAVVPVPENVTVATSQESGAVKAFVSWFYPSVIGHKHQFRFDLSERFHHNQMHFGDPTAFRYRIAEMPPHVVYAEENVTSLSTILPIDLSPNEEYRLTIFAMNDQLCHSDDVTVPFFTEPATSQETILKPTGISNDTESSHHKEVQHNATGTVAPDDGPTIREPAAGGSLYPPVAVLTTTFALVTAVALACCLAYCLVCKFYKNGKSQIEKSSIIPWAMAHSR
ncbi:unnamed protein product [Gongylonema pulchrum]|uniref:Fibronectin type-III domain-containing protein n=1 Tax=Gongylonema pulchrum TaxID=637853 RepID=A0A183D2A2_9BILA|nr:unnamed protein product [Gongylonema pulchrum]